VIEMRYGLTGHQARTLEEVGRAFGVTRERIRQIENNTLKKLEGLPEAQRLRDAAP
jgi:RNA polymerase primary sigma factor